MPRSQTIDDANAPRPPVPMQFDDFEQQRLASGLGMWTFIITEVMFFGALFCGYVVYRMTYPGGFAEASHHLYRWIGATNTAVLLISSFTMAMAVHAAEHRQRRALISWLMLTAGLGSVFIGIKGYEYYLDYHEKLLPVIRFDEARLEHPAAVELFMVLYYCMTGLHAVHLIIGITLVLGMAAMVWMRRWFVRGNPNAIVWMGLYWHFVDIVWIFLFPVLYTAQYTGGGAT